MLFRYPCGVDSQFVFLSELHQHAHHHLHATQPCQRRPITFNCTLVLPLSPWRVVITVSFLIDDIILGRTSAPFAVAGTILLQEFNLLLMCVYFTRCRDAVKMCKRICN